MCELDYPAHDFESLRDIGLAVPFVVFPPLCVVVVGRPIIKFLKEGIDFCITKVTKVIFWCYFGNYKSPNVHFLCCCRASNVCSFDNPQTNIGF